jgi:hypothetical protein
MIAAVSTYIPSHFGWATTLSNVALGAVMIPTNLENTFIGAGVGPVCAVAVAISVLSWRTPTGGLYPWDERLYRNLQYDDFGADVSELS